MIGGWQGMLVGGLALAGVAGLAGFRAGENHGLSSAAKQIAPVITGLNAEIAVLKVEKAQAVAEVAKVNATTAAQVAELKSLLTADADARAAASIRVEKAAQLAAANAKEAGARAQAAMEVIRNVADECARAGVPPDVKRMLDGILAPARP